MIKCELCGRREARYVCQECGRRVCELCIDPYTWTCIDCLEKIKPKLTRMPATQTTTPINTMAKIFTIGFIVIFIGMIIMMIAAILGAGQVSGGIVIFPFIPIPLIIGYGPEALSGIIIAIVLAAIMIVLILILTRKTMPTSL
ncbi:MAG: B-box zinc finger protein [archaeon GB-1867-005]|nr:B-box zinc finger protein [Candidatus Culexmicrobium cathedralense]